MAGKVYLGSQFNKVLIHHNWEVIEEWPLWEHVTVASYIKTAVFLAEIRKQRELG